MAFLNKSNFQQNKEYLMTGDTRPAPSMDQKQKLSDAGNTPALQPWGAKSTGSGGAAGGGSSISSAPDMDLQTTSAPQTDTTVEERRPDGTMKTTTTATKPVFKTTGSLNQRLYDPLTQGAEAGQQKLNEASAAFRQMAGPSRTFESIGGAGTLNQAVNTGQGFEDARALANAQYGGPAGLNAGSLADIQLMQEQMQTRQRALGTGGGLTSLIQGAAPGITRGEAEFEAKRKLADSKVRARDLGFSAVNPFGQQITQGAQEARDFAGQRTDEEQAIQDASRGLLGGKQDVISADLQQAIDAAQAQQTGAEAAYGNIQGAEGNRLDEIAAAAPYLQSGTVEDPGDLSGAEVAEKFRSPGYLQTQEGKALMEQIMGQDKFASIRNYDPLSRGVGGRGKMAYETDGRDVRQVEKDRGQRGLLYDRQRELEAQFGGARGKGDFSVTNPLYYGDEFQQADPSSYLGFDPGTRPSRENLSSGQQREHFNRITDLLGSLDQIGEKSPFRAAKIFAEAERYLDEEKATLDAKGEDMTKADKEWAGMVKKARKRYKKKKRQSEYAQIGAGVGAALGPVGSVAGYGVGKALA